MLALLLGFYPLGSLDNYLAKNHSTITWVERTSWAVQIASAVNHLHVNMQILHRDLKCANVFLRSDKTAVLGDFGSALFLQDQESNKESGVIDFVGSGYWIAPEVFEGTEQGQASDIYSFGMCMVEIATGQPPFYNDARAKPDRECQQWLVVESKGRPKVPQKDDDSSDHMGFYQLMEKCWQSDAQKRPLAPQLLADLIELHAREHTLDAMAKTEAAQREAEAKEQRERTASKAAQQKPPSRRPSFRSFEQPSVQPEAPKPAASVAKTLPVPGMPSGQRKSTAAAKPTANSRTSQAAKPLSSQDPDVEAILCPVCGAVDEKGGSTLVALRSRVASIICNVCNRRLPKGSPIMVCCQGGMRSRCNFDSCEDCYKKAIATKRHSLAPPTSPTSPTSPLSATKSVGSDLDESIVLFCNQGHLLQAHWVDSSLVQRGLYCDQCGKTQPLGATVYSCRRPGGRCCEPCSYDVCIECAKKSQKNALKDDSDDNDDAALPDMFGNKYDDDDDDEPNLDDLFRGLFAPSRILKAAPRPMSDATRQKDVRFVGGPLGLRPIEVQAARAQTGRRAGPTVMMYGPGGRIIRVAQPW